MTVLKGLRDTVVALYKHYPARANSYVAGGIVAIAGAFGLGLHIGTVAGIVAVVGPLIVGELTHHKVRPVK